MHCIVCKVVANGSEASDPQGARKFRMASYIVTTAGMAITVVVIVIVVLAVNFDYWTCRYSHDGVCYRYESRAYSAEECWEKNGVYDDGICYYD